MSIETAVCSAPNHDTNSHQFPAPERAAIAGLDRPELYRAALALLRERQRGRGGLAQAGLALEDLPESADAELARKLAKRVASGAYAFSPVAEREAHLGGKWRKVYRAPLVDTVVLFVLAGALTALVSPCVSERVYSYRKGRSSRQAVRDLVRFVRAHRAAERDISKRGLHVLRRDVSGYGDRIPVHEASPLWPLLTRSLSAGGCAADDPLHGLLKGALRPVVARLDGTLERATAGVPMGSPLQPSICNLYLDALDRELEALPGGFYARFGDDMLFAHASAEITRTASAHVDRVLAALGLVLNAEKSRDLFWNGAGRLPPHAVSPSERGTTHVEYLGSCVAFDGGIAPSRRKLRCIRSELRERIVTSERLLRDTALEARVHALTGAVSTALDPKSEVALPLASELWSDCDDRRLLAQLDHWIARTLSQALTGAPGARGFRSAPPRFLRENGLVSLVSRRDRAKSRRRSEREP